MSDAKFKTYVVTDGENGDVFGNAKTISDLRRFMYESDKKDARIRELEEENKMLNADLKDHSRICCEKQRTINNLNEFVRENGLTELLQEWNKLC